MRSSVLVFIDGTICDLTHRHILKGTSDFEKDSEILKDVAVGDGAACMTDLAEKYDLVYIGARSKHTADITKTWLNNTGFPDGVVVCGGTQGERMAAVMELKKDIHFAAGIGDRWDDNELHLALGCMSIILEEYNCNWNTVRKYLLNNTEA